MPSLMPLASSITFSIHPLSAGGGLLAHFAVAAAALVPIALVIWLYRTEMTLVRPAVARSLLALRLTAVAVVLAALLFRPGIGRSLTETVRGRVVVAFDRSDSMEVTDPQRPLIEKLRLARALRLVGDLANDRKLDDWISATSTSTAASDGGTSGSLDEQHALERVAERVNGLTRRDVGAALLNNAGWLERVEADHDVMLLGFAGSAGSLPHDAISRAGVNGAATDLSAPLEAALAAAGDAPPVAVVLLTDGRHNAGAPPTTPAASLGRLGVPVHSIVLGPRTPPTDAAILQARAPAVVFRGAEAMVELGVQVHGLSARTLTVELQRPNRPPIVEQIAHPGGSKLHTLRLPVTLEDAGEHQLTARLRPEPEDTHPENDARSVTIQVADDRAKVLLIDGEARWEFHYLASALARDRSIDLTSVVFSQPRIGRPADNPPGLPARHWPKGPDALDRYDAVILGDVPPDLLGPAERAQLDRYVSDRGGTLILVAGKRSMPLAYLRLRRDDDPMHKLIPLDLAMPVAANDGFRVNLTTDGRQASFMQLAATAESSEQVWSQLPKHFWGMSGRAKPGATVLASDRDPAATQSNDSAFDAREHALIVRQNVGFGRVLYIGLDSTWRWRFRAGDALHHRFWGQVLRWAASDQALIVGNRTVRFGPRRPLVPEGEPVEIGVRWLDTTRPLRESDRAAVRLWRRQPEQADAQIAEAPLHRPDDRPRDLEARFPHLPAGDYLAELVIPERAADLPTLPGTNAPVRAAIRVSPAESVERRDLSTNIPLLEQIASLSGGRVVMPEDASDLASELARKTVTREVHREWLFERSWAMLIALVLLLGAEWTIRKLVGLP
mgnify:CR=1 FL=1